MTDYLVIDSQTDTCQGQKVDKHFIYEEKNLCDISGKIITKPTTHHYFWPFNILEHPELKEIITKRFRKKLKLITFKLCKTCHNHDIGYHPFFVRNTCDTKFCIEDCKYEKICCYYPLKIIAKNSTQNPELKTIFKNINLRLLYLEQVKIHLTDWGAQKQAKLVEKLLIKQI